MGSKVVGLQRWRAVLFSISVIIIIVLVSNLYSKQVAAKASDFTIEDGVLTKYLGAEKEIVIPKGVKTIGKAAFLGINHTLIQYRGNKTDIKIPNKITVIGYGAFRNCSFINNVSIPEGVLEIGVAAFAGCTGLKIIDLPDSIVRVWAQAFYGCSNLEKIIIPENVDIRRDSLEGTKWMNDYKGDFVMLKGNLLVYQGTESRVVIPDQVTTVCTGAFFDNDYVTEITIPAKVTKLAYAAFNYCDNLEKIFISNNNIYLEYETFLLCNKKLTLYGVIGGPVEDYAKQNNLQFISYGINKKKVTLYLEGNNSTVLKVNGLNGTVSWKSENSSIANVNSSGKVTAVKEGTTKIMATANDITLECEIVVKLPYISKKTVSISKGHTARLNIIGVTSEITWSSSNKSIATVSKTGVVTAKNVGTATITATVNGKKYTCKVTVHS